jgi:spore coat polysaccharide biosynthesis protein SpsF
MIGLIIFSRFDSIRLPGKALVNIGTKPLLQHVVDRAKNVTEVKKIIIATTERDIDEPIRALAKLNNLDYFCGELEDVAARAIAACERFGFDSFLRICGDRPIFDSDAANKMCVQWREINCDMLTTNGENPVPPGLTCELVRLSTFKNYYSKFTAFDREHLTSYYYNNPQKLSIKVFETPDYLTDTENIRLVVDDEVDVERMKWILSKYDQLPKEEKKHMEAVIRLNIAWNDQNALIKTKSGEIK